ncbi:MAG: SH3 domain-containing protein [Anaerolineae bacterium]|nr:SH3 domain-containing protein [Anaerolineae bacterium]
MRAKRITTIGLAAILTVIGLVASAQDASPTLPPDTTGAGCQAPLLDLWTAASDVCINGPEGFICNGGAAPLAEPAGPVANALAPTGALVESGLVDFIQTPALSPETGSIGVAWLRTPAPVRFTALLIGNTSLRDMSPPEFPAWQSMMVQTAPEISSCGAAPLNVLILQSPVELPARIAVNGVSLYLNGTVLVRAAFDQTLIVSLSGATAVTASGQQQDIVAGQQLVLAHAPGDYSRPTSPPSPPSPYEPAVTRNLPIALFDRPFVLPQPGFVTTRGTINLRVFPSTDAGIIREVPAGQIATVLGVNPAGDWYNVRINTGETGWMKADLLLTNVGSIEAVFDATPSIPQRYGLLGTTGIVISPAGVNLRLGPDGGFPALAALNGGTTVQLLARSPYSPWVKVSVGDVTGWIALVALDTRAYLDAIPIDFTAPPQPTPTRVPGSFGNAFPDPNSPGD